MGTHISIGNTRNLRPQLVSGSNTMIKYMLSIDLVEGLQRLYTIKYQIPYKMWILVFTLHKKMVMSYQNTSLTNKCRVTIKRKIIDLELHKAENRLPPFFAIKLERHIYIPMFFTPYISKMGSYLVSKQPKNCIPYSHQQTGSVAWENPLYKHELFY